MKNRRTPLFLLLIGLLLCILSGCSLLPDLFPQDAGPSSAALKLQIGSAAPEDIILTWDPSAVAVDNAEVSVSENGLDSSRTVTVTVQLHPSQ